MDEVNKIIAKLKLSDIKDLKKDKQRDYHYFVGSFSGKEILLKIIPRKDIEKIAGLKREIFAESLFSQFTPEFKRVKVVDTGETENYIWLMREYVLGEPLSLYDHQKFMAGNDYIQTRFSPKYLEIMESTLNNLTNLEILDGEIAHLEENIKYLTLPKDIFDFTKVNTIEKTLKLDFSKQVDFCETIMKEYFSDKNIGGCIKDLAPSNIIISGENVILSDFEHFCFRNKTYDIAYLWLFLWRYPDWQNIIIQKIIKLGWEDFFRASLIGIVIDKYLDYFNLERPIDERLIWNRKIYSDHIWLQYLIAAGESFEAILKVK